RPRRSTGQHGGGRAGLGAKSIGEDDALKALVTCAAGCATCEERPVEVRRGPLRAGPLTVALIGQPNCGKSTLFNAVAGYRSATGNFSGTTVRLAWSQVRVNGSLVELVDVPGIYSLTTSRPRERAGR